MNLYIIKIVTSFGLRKITMIDKIDLSFIFSTNHFISLSAMGKTLLNLPEESSLRVMDYSFVTRRNKSLGCTRGLLSRIRLRLSRSFRSGFRKGYYVKSAIPTETNFSAVAMHTATLNAYTGDTCGETGTRIARRKTHVQSHTSER